MLASRSAVVFFFSSVDMEKGVVSPTRGLTKQKGMVRECRAVPLPAAAARESSRVFKHTSHMDMCNMYMLYMCMYAAHGRSG